MGIRVLLCCFLLQNTDYKNSLLFTPFSATRFAMHRIYADRINSRGMSRVFCDLRSHKTPRGILPVNSNQNSHLYFRPKRKEPLCRALAEGWKKGGYILSVWVVPDIVIMLYPITRSLQSSTGASQ